MNLPPEFGISNTYVTVKDGNGNIVMEGTMGDMKTQEINIEKEGKSNMQDFNTISRGDFKSGKCVVNCKTEALADEFLALCEGNGFKWCSGERLSGLNMWNKYGAGTCYANCYSDGASYGMEFCNTDYFKNNSIPIVEFTGFETKPTDKEIIKNATLTLNVSPPTETTKESIEVIYHRSETIVLIKTGGKHYRGVSRCHVEDTYNKEVGFGIALERAREKQKEGRY